MKLFKYEGYKITISEEALALIPFKKIWTRDRSANKNRAISELGFIYFMADNSLAKVFITQAGDSPSSAAVATNYNLAEVYSLEEAKTL